MLMHGILSMIPLKDITENNIKNVKTYLKPQGLEVMIFEYFSPRVALYVR